MFDSLLNAMHLSDIDDEDEYEDDDYEEEEPAPLFKKNQRQVAEARPAAKAAPAPRTQQPKAAPAKITPMRNSKKGGSSMGICAIKPTSFEDAKEISETLLADQTVILNMDGIDLGVAQRIIDFVCGTCFAIDGNLQKVSSYIFIITPSGVELSGDLQGFVDAFDFNGIQTGF